MVAIFPDDDLRGATTVALSVIAPVANEVSDLLALAASGAGADWAKLRIGDEQVAWPDATAATGVASHQVTVTSPFGTTGTLQLGPSASPERLRAIADHAVTTVERWLDHAAEANASEDLTRRLFISEERLADSLLELEASNRQLENFAYIASHELLHPLRAVSAFVDLLPDLVRSSNEAGLDAAVAHIREGTESMQLQVTALLELAAPTETLEVVELIDPSEAARTAMHGLDAVFDEHGATVDIDDLPVVRARRVPLQSIFHNLLLNALRYSDPTRPLRVRISGQRDPLQARITVEDNGIGIDPEDQQRIFGIFERAAADRSGSGIGLALAVRIMQSIGGSISLESEPGQGSAFTLHFPDERLRNGSAHQS